MAGGDPGPRPRGHAVRCRRRADRQAGAHPARPSAHQPPVAAARTTGGAWQRTVAERAHGGRTVGTLAEVRRRERPYWCHAEHDAGAPLLISDILRHGQQVHGDSAVITVEAGRLPLGHLRRGGGRAEKLASALGRLGIAAGDRVGTFCWNNQDHLEAYLAVPCMGAVLHTLNIRLSPTSWPT